MNRGQIIVVVGKLRLAALLVVVAMESVNDRVETEGGIRTVCIQSVLTPDGWQSIL